MKKHEIIPVQGCTVLPKDELKPGDCYEPIGAFRVSSRQDFDLRGDIIKAPYHVLIVGNKKALEELKVVKANAESSVSLSRWARKRAKWIKLVNEIT